MVAEKTEVGKKLRTHPPYPTINSRPGRSRTLGSCAPKVFFKSMEEVEDVGIDVDGEGGW